MLKNLESAPFYCTCVVYNWIIMDWSYARGCQSRKGEDHEKIDFHLHSWNRKLSALKIFLIFSLSILKTKSLIFFLVYWSLVEESLDWAYPSRAPSHFKILFPSNPFTEFSKIISKFFQTLETLFCSAQIPFKFTSQHFQLVVPFLKDGINPLFDNTIEVVRVCLPWFPLPFQNTRPN